MPEQIFTNASLILADKIVQGTLVVENGRIREFSDEKCARGMDMDGDYVMPGLVELHTDHLESHLQPRPKVRWPAASAIAAYDAQIAASGITTVFDCIRAGRDVDNTSASEEVFEVLESIDDARAAGLLRADHRIHVRCEVCVDDVVELTEGVMKRYPVSLISLMDHTPGARQFRAMEAWRTYYGGKTGLPPVGLDELVIRKQQQYERNYARHRKLLVDLAAAHGAVLASHDDTTEAHVAESIADNVAIAEFPTTLEAARKSHEARLKVVMGAPNVVRGGSHSGNVSAEELARAGVLDILSSDYVPASLLLGAFAIAQRVETISLPQAIATITRTPAEAAGLDDRGEIAPGKRADLVRVRMNGAFPIVREVYRHGERIV